MAKIYGKGSKYLFWNDLKYFFIANGFIPIIFFVSIYFIAINMAKLKGNSTFIIISVVVIMFFVRQIAKECKEVQKLSNNKSDKFFHGRKGEEEVMEVLKNLPDDYIIFRNANLYKKGDIDLILLGPCGLLTIEVKNYPGNIIFENGKLKTTKGYFKKDFMKQAMNEAIDLNCYLKEKIKKDIFVKPIIVFSNKYTSMRFGLKSINNIFVVQKEYLIKLIESFPIAISREEANIIEQELSLLYK